MNKFEQKMYYQTCGFILAFANLLLIGTRFNQFGLFLGLVGAGFFIKALTIRKS